MAALKSVWGIDIGQSALKALKLREVDGQLQAEAFDIIEHPKILSQPDADRPQLIRNAIEQFLSRNDVTNSLIAVAVPGQSSFTRFVKLPPVEPKRIGDIVRFEAEQQIPFDINEVIWRWQAFPDPDSPDIEVGLFAIKRNDVYNALAPLQEMMVGVDFVQMAPLSLYNFMTYDQQAAPEGATLLMDIGADSTNLVVSDGPRLWTRTIQLGGNSFTEALVKAFKLSFSKAEKLKRTAATSKYARQIFQAMRPVFADLVQEIQRSVGYYTSLHREARFKRLVGIGNGFRLPGLQKFLEQNLNLPVVRVDNFNALQPSPTISAPTFTENVLSFAVAYGLAVQGLELSRVDTNLLPEEIASHRRWSKKRPWFAGAAVLLVLASLGMAFRSVADKSVLGAESAELSAARSMESRYNSLRQNYQRIVNQGENEKKQAQDLLKLQGYAGFWVGFVDVLSQALRAEMPHQAYMNDNSESLSQLQEIPPAQRRLLVLTSLQSEYLPDVTNADLGGAVTGAPGRTTTAAPGSGGPPPGFGMGYGMPPGMGGPPGMSMPPGMTDQQEGVGAAERGFRIIMTGRCPMNRADATSALKSLLHSSRQIATERYGDQFEIVKEDIISFEEPVASGPAGPGGMTGPGMTGPGMGYGMGMPPGMSGPSGTGARATGAVDFAGRPIDEDVRFRIGWIVKIKGDGIAPLTEENEQR